MPKQKIDVTVNKTSRPRPPAKSPAENSTPPPKGKSKILIWVLAGCGGCLIIVIILAVLGYFFLQDRLGEVFEDFNTVNESNDIIVNFNTNAENVNDTNENTAQNDNSGANSNDNTNTTFKDLNLNTISNTNGDDDEDIEKEHSEGELRAPDFNQALFENYFIEPGEVLVDWKKWDADQDRLEEGCALTLLPDGTYRAFILDWNSTSLTYDISYDQIWDPPMDSIIIKDWDFDGWDDFVLVEIPNSGAGIGLIYDPNLEGYIEIYPFEGV